MEPCCLIQSIQSINMQYGRINMQNISVSVPLTIEKFSREDRTIIDFWKTFDLIKRFKIIVLIFDNIKEMFFKTIRI